MNEARKPTVLVVDDAPENLHVLMEALKADYAILAATSGEKALELAAKKNPDLILLDVLMPGLDGYEVCRRLKADPHTEEIPVIFITGLADEDDEVKGLSLGAIDYVTKPFNPLLVKARVKNHIALQQAAKLKVDVERIVRHDVKTPLTCILSAPQLLLMADNLTDEQRDMLKRVEEAAYTVLSMINFSLDLFKMERGLYKARAEEVDLLPILYKILGAKEDAIASNKLGVVFRREGATLGQHEEFTVMGEDLLCYSLFANLLSNAVEASQEGQAIHIDLAQGEWATVAIHNAGVVPASIRDRFFEKYATAGKERGTGLGTYSAMLIAKNQGGNIEMETSEDMGTTVTVTLPAASAG